MGIRRFLSWWATDAGVRRLANAMAAGLVLLSAAGPAWAADEAAGLQDMTLARCIEIAVRGNRTLQRLELVAARRREAVTRAGREVFDPALSASWSGANDGDDEQSGEVALGGKLAGFEVEPFIRYKSLESDDGREETSAYGVAVARDLFRVHEGLRQRLPLSRATREMHKAANVRVQELRALQLAVTEAFFDVQGLLLRVRIRRDRVRDAREFLRVVEVKVGNGFVPAADVTNAKISLNQAEADLVREETTLAAAREALLDLMGLPLDTPCAIREEDVETVVPPAVDLAADLARVRQDHEQVVNKELDLRTFEDERRVNRDRLIPSVRGEVSAAREEERETGETDDGTTWSLALDVPLDGFRAERAQVREDNLHARELGLELEEVRRGLERELRARHRELGRWESTVKLAVERFDAEAAKYDAMRKRYEAGGVDNLEVTRASQALDEAQIGRLEARINRILAAARYNALVPPDAP